MDPYLICLISTYVPEHASILTELAGGRIIKEIKDGKTYANGAPHCFDNRPFERNFYRRIWYNLGRIHRDNDKPAVIYRDQARLWFKNGKLHRDNDLPAVIKNNGTKEWYKNGQSYQPSIWTRFIFFVKS